MCKSPRLYAAAGKKAAAVAIHADDQRKIPNFQPLDRFAAKILKRDHLR